MIKTLLDRLEKESAAFRLSLGKDGRSALVLGYKIDLTESEYLIIDSLLRIGKPMSKASFEEECGVAASSVPVHIANINKKAYPITGRRLIEYNKAEGYTMSKTI